MNMPYEYLNIIRYHKQVATNTNMFESLIRDPHVSFLFSHVLTSSSMFVAATSLDAAQTSSVHSLSGGSG